MRVINWPVRDDPAYALGVFSLVATSAAAVAWAAASRLTGLVVLSALLLTTWRLWLPVTCDLTPAGLALRCLRWQRQLRWRQIAGVAVVPGGVMLQCRRAGLPATGVIRLFVPWRHHPHLVADFFAYYGAPARGARPVDRGPAPATTPH